VNSLRALPDLDHPSHRHGETVAGGAPAPGRRVAAVRQVSASILRLSAGVRVAIAAGLSVVLWALVAWAMS
jgi:hypothetical protein